MKRKNLLSVALTATLLLTSCRFQDNTAKNKSVDNVQTYPSNQAYDGVKDVLGKDYGKFKMPDKVTTTDFAGLYKLYINTSVFTKDSDELDYPGRGEECAKRIFGDKFDSKNALVEKSDRSLIPYIQKNAYIYTDEDTGEECHYSIVQWYNDEEMDNFLPKDSVLENMISYNESPDEKVELSDGQASLSELWKLSTDFLEKSGMMDDYSEYKICPSYALVFSNPAGDYVQLCCGLTYDGTMLQEMITPYDDLDEKGQTHTYYKNTNITFTFFSKDKISGFHNSGGFDELNKTEPVDSIISLKSAVELLEKELAPNIVPYNFTDVKLMYCYKYAEFQPRSVMVDNSLDHFDPADEEEYRESHKKPDVFVPTWCFVIDQNEFVRNEIKVDAITGEITIDTE